MRKINEIKLVALDVDGTLIGPDLKIPAVTREAIQAARRRGVWFAIVTGRMYRAAAPFARELGLEGPLVAYNGGLVKEFPSGRTLFHRPLSQETGVRLAAFCEERGYYVQAYVDDLLYVPTLGPEAEAYASVAKVEAHPVGPLSRWLDRPSTKMLIVADADRIPQIQSEVKELLGESATVAQSYPTFLEIFDRRVSKGGALEAIADQLGYSREQVMAVGDAMNDVSMLQWAGTSFAMAHAADAVKQAATHVTNLGPGYGVAEALRTAGLV